MLKENIKYEDIDSSFLDFEPSNKLPEEVIKTLVSFLSHRRLAYQNYRNGNEEYTCYLEDIYYFSKFRNIFSLEGVDIWKDLYNDNPEATKKLISYFSSIKFYTNLDKNAPLIIPNRLDSVLYLKKQMEEIEFLLDAMTGTITDEGGWEYISEDERSRCLQYEIHKELQEKVVSYLKNLETLESNLKGFDNSKREAGYRESHKKNVKNAEAIFLIKSISYHIKKLFGKPYHNHVATFINAAFDTEYDYASIAQIVRKRESYAKR